MENQPSRTRVLSMTCTAEEEQAAKALAGVNDEPVSHVLRRFFDFDGLRAEYERKRSAFLAEAETV